MTDLPSPCRARHPRRRWRWRFWPRCGSVWAGVVPPSHRAQAAIMERCNSNVCSAYLGLGQSLSDIVGFNFLVCVCETAFSGEGPTSLLGLSRIYLGRVSSGEHWHNIHLCYTSSAVMGKLWLLLMLNDLVHVIKVQHRGSSYSGYCQQFKLCSLSLLPAEASQYWHSVWSWGK